MEVLNGCKVVGKAVVSKADQKRVYVRVSRATHHENESASQILVAVDLTTVSGSIEEPRKEDRGKSQILCTYYRFEHFSERASFPLAGSPGSIVQARNRRRIPEGAILWETARRFGKVMTSGYLNRVLGEHEQTHTYQTSHNKFVCRLVVRILMESHFIIIIFELWILRIKSFVSYCE